jgi:rare lipoprotein A
MNNGLRKKILRPKIRVSVLLTAFFWIVFGCASKPPPPPPSGYPKPYKVGRNWYQPILHARDFRQKGRASWYGRKFHGRKTSNGEIYDMYAMTAAHKTLPFNTHVKVYNLQNDKTTVVRVNDRGPFVRGRIIDLSYTAAKALGIVGPGTAPVEIVALGAVAPDQPAGLSEPKYIPQDYYSGKFTFQVYAFKDKTNAERAREKLAEKYKNVHIVVFDNGTETFYRVRVGLAHSLEQADEYENMLIEDGFEDAFVVAE